MSWQGKILRVDLTKGVCTPEPLNMEWAQKYLGQRGLAGKYLAEEMNPKVDSLSPENKMIFATGPLTGTGAATGGRWSVVTKGALNNAISDSNSGGYFGAELKFAGWDMIIFEGKAKKPVYLFIEDDKVELLPAGDLWGKTVWETEPAIRDIHGDPMLKIASIGPAGESGVRYACVMNDMDRAAGRSGVGAVMGSKNLKAVAVRGTKGVAVHDPQAFMKAVAEGRAKLDPSPATKIFTDGGTLPMMDTTNKYGLLPTLNCREVQFDGVESVNVATMKRVRPTDGKANLLTNKGCFACTIGCGRVSKMDPTHFSVKERPEYHGASGGLEYESAFSFGPMAGVTDFEAMTFANYMSNEYGMDPISLGVTIAAAMELFDVGAITTKETGGIELKFGSAEALVKLAEMTGKGEGFGKDIGLGAKRLCEKYGHPEFAMVVKGQEFPGYDPRGMKGMGLAYATSSRGACHMRAKPWSDDFARNTTDDKAALVKATQDEVSAIDSSGICFFATNVWTLDDLAPQIEAACGGGWTSAKMMEVGERIFNLEREFNLRSGLTKADDTLPERCLKEGAKTGPAKGSVAGLDKMLPEYYALRGWTKDGVPTNETLERLAL
jgi:aldehyde:ferredoxin oxidoreductase